ncbi:hypothetical protein FO440_01490 [Mucilaginibacter corticis]|uniref:Uncharacterized protein n=1 Tax=Mucilaginibacter corticis TaxID=2597670 RepID=A0A556MSV6_9SPHI|nr:hypothetical protein [Mucilaginibacter corticis]TSJ42888.1 hypothetical protein FO440_01490 [Mucilaginibacter corticis]
MGTSDTVEFIPEGDKPSPNKKLSGFLLINAFTIIIWYLLMHNKHSYDNGMSWLFICLILIPVDSSILFFSQDPVMVTLFKAEGTLQYDYTDFWGNEKSRTIDLKTAYYKYALSSNNVGGAMRLLIYNNYFKNQVVIRASDKMGFNRLQLDEIVAGIKEIQDNLQSNT